MIRTPQHPAPQTERGATKTPFPGLSVECAMTICSTATTTTMAQPKPEIARVPAD
ncbi:hypothetical protein M419DRAFT_118720 [Trichoderma reesei RUT C-30]|uniref:Uncharacterized protein n=1 Tax=Hypocrea jecorina (strain ATCC 56765 / BCRC 32924 / NRRL 11460 / Rut C-30) TaxID=1344414 RepID=A0A024SB26_HYPJR|nr:hypothetical protein M419DRAFT_118720 [Trichoderma reesei RUT C-30]